MRNYETIAEATTETAKGLVNLAELRLNEEGHDAMGNIVPAGSEVWVYWPADYDGAIAGDDGLSGYFESRADAEAHAQNWADEQAALDVEYEAARG